MAATDTVFTDILDSVGFINKFPLLAKATSDSDISTPGYMYGEINKISFESAAYCGQLLDYLLSRLGKDSPQVKLKVLKIIYHIVLNGHRDFRQALRRKDGRVKEGVCFSGSYEHSSGIYNASYAAVRAEAGKVLQALYDSDLLNNDMEDQEQMPPKEVFQFTGMGSSKRSGKYEGFGNSPITSNKSIAERVVGNLAGMVNKLMGSTDSDLKRESNCNYGNYKPVEAALLDKLLSDNDVSIASSSSASDNPPSFTEQSIVAISPSPTVAATMPAVAGSTGKIKQKIRAYKPGRAGGGWDDDELLDGAISLISFDIPLSESSQPSNVSLDSLEQDVTLDFLQEEELVKEIASETAPIYCSGLELQDLVKQRVCPLNAQKIVCLLNEQLKTAGVIAKLRILLILEFMIHFTVVPLGFLTDTLMPTLDELQKNDNFERGQIKARKMLLLLKVLQTRHNLEQNKAETVPSLAQQISYGSFEAVEKIME